MRPLVSVIVVNWNGQKWLKRCLDSLLSQTYKKIEVIMVDNASTDGSVGFVEKNYPEVKILHSENKGYGHGCNVGANAARGEFLMFFNEDMYVDKDFLEDYIEQFNKITDDGFIGTVGCSISDYDRKLPPEGPAYGMTIDLMATPTPNHKRSKIFHNSGCPLFISRKLFLKVGGFCENIFLYSEDLDLCWRLNLYGYQHYFFPDIHIYHYGGGVIGGFSPTKLSYYIRGELNSMVNNFSLLLLPAALTYFSLFYLFLSSGYLLTGKLGYAKNIYRTIGHELRYNLKSMLSFRKIVQSNRVVSDWRLLRRINIVPSRLKNSIQQQSNQQAQT